MLSSFVPLFDDLMFRSVYLHTKFIHLWATITIYFRVTW